MQLGTERKKRKSAIINVTSLIDVVLLLLIFFMLTTQFVQQPGMKLDLPETKSGKTAENQENTLMIDEKGNIYLNDQKVDMMDLNLKLSALVDSSSSENAIVLKADKTNQYGKVVKFMELAQTAGFQKLIIATTPESVSE
jgi:biopolymer transport protein ExbD